MREEMRKEMREEIDRPAVVRRAGAGSVHEHRV